jgi:hypothetical protein
MMLKIHLHGAVSYEVGDEIWQEALCNAIQAEAEAIADHASSDLLESPDPHQRAKLRHRIAVEMTDGLIRVGDTYRAPDGVLYSLVESPPESHNDDTLARVIPSPPIVEEVLEFEDLPAGSNGSRRAIVRWSDGTESEALRWWSDEILSPVDRVGRQ